jgi:hypothetical protein
MTWLHPFFLVPWAPTTAAPKRTWRPALTSNSDPAFKIACEREKEAVHGAHRPLGQLPFGPITLILSEGKGVSIERGVFLPLRVRFWPGPGPKRLPKVRAIAHFTQIHKKDKIVAVASGLELQWIVGWARNP